MPRQCSQGLGPPLDLGPPSFCCRSLVFLLLVLPLSKWCVYAYVCFWFSQCASFQDEAVEREMFTTRWSTLRKSYLPKRHNLQMVSFKYMLQIVGILLEKSTYDLTTSNCQHFARNLYAALDPSEAKFLNIDFEPHILMKLTAEMQK